MKTAHLFENNEDQEQQHYRKLYVQRVIERVGLTNYTINSDGTVDVDGNVDISGIMIGSIEIPFRRVTGYFSCMDNYLSSLMNCPEEVGGRFNCSDNHLTDLEHGPTIVHGDYLCVNCNLTSLKGLAREIGGSLYCQHNHLTDLITDRYTEIQGRVFCPSNKFNKKIGPRVKRLRAEGGIAWQFPWNEY